MRCASFSTFTRSYGHDEKGLRFLKSSLISTLFYACPKSWETGLWKYMVLKSISFINAVIVYCFIIIVLLLSATFAYVLCLYAFFAKATPGNEIRIELRHVSYLFKKEKKKANISNSKEIINEMSLNKYQHQQYKNITGMKKKRYMLIMK